MLQLPFESKQSSKKFNPLPESLDDVVDFVPQLVSCILHDFWPGVRFAGCFDGWNNREYRSGSQYVRRRDMSADGRIKGEYSCSCNSGRMRCSGCLPDKRFIIFIISRGK